jgi:hypothetical protein
VNAGIYSEYEISPLNATIIQLEVEYYLLLHQKCHVSFGRAKSPVNPHRRASDRVTFGRTVHRLLGAAASRGLGSLNAYYHMYFPIRHDLAWRFPPRRLDDCIPEYFRVSDRGQGR